MKNKNESIGVIIVTYNYNYYDLINCVESIYNQINEILIVDNGSFDNDSLEKVKEKYENVQVIYNKENLGIAKALNIGVDYFTNKKCNWILSLDQDSKCDKFFIFNMLKAYFQLSDIEKSKTAMLVPNWVDVNLKNNKTNFEDNGICKVFMAISSGSLYKTKIFSKVGYFDENLFIDGVDHEFCLRLHINNFQILKINKCTLYHRLGDSKIRKFLWMDMLITNHSPVRRYYITRNRFYILDKYKYYFPELDKRRIIHVIIQIIKITLYEDEKYEKYKMILKGFKDAKNKKFGKFKIIN